MFAPYLASWCADGFAALLFHSLLANAHSAHPEKYFSKLFSSLQRVRWLASTSAMENWCCRNRRTFLQLAVQRLGHAFRSLIQNGHVKKDCRNCARVTNPWAPLCFPPGTRKTPYQNQHFLNKGVVRKDRANEVSFFVVALFAYHPLIKKVLFFKKVFVEIMFNKHASSCMCSHIFVPFRLVW